MQSWNSKFHFFLGLQGNKGYKLQWLNCDASLTLQYDIIYSIDRCSYHDVDILFFFISCLLASARTWMINLT
jgi:hypothetical protein